MYCSSKVLFHYLQATLTVKQLLALKEPHSIAVRKEALVGLKKTYEHYG